MNWPFSREDVQAAKKYLEKCSVSLAIIEMQIKVTLKFCFTPVRMAVI